MNTHYLPQFLLEQFRQPSLYKMDITTGAIDQCAVDKAGSSEDIWPAEIEKGIMGEFDNDAARILRNKVWGQRQINLSENDRLGLGKWLALFMARVPIIPETLKKMRDQFDADPERAVAAMYEDQPKALEVIRAYDTQVYDQVISVIGKDEGEKQMLLWAAERIRDKSVPYLPDVYATYHQHLRGLKDIIQALAKRLAKMHWTWYRTPKGFCIGDNPFVRWHLGKQRPLWNVALRNDVEFSFPFSTELTLCISKQNRGNRIVLCNREHTRRFNHRQRFNAFSSVYANARELLNPQARFGFDVPSSAIYSQRKLVMPALLRKIGMNDGAKT